jgi:hypothetical protein
VQLLLFSLAGEGVNPLSQVTEITLCLLIFAKRWNRHAVPRTANRPNEATNRRGLTRLKSAKIAALRRPPNMQVIQDVAGEPIQPIQ